MELGTNSPNVQTEKDFHRLSLSHYLTGLNSTRVPLHRLLEAESDTNSIFTGVKFSDYSDGNGLA